MTPISMEKVSSSILPPPVTVQMHLIHALLPQVTQYFVTIPSPRQMAYVGQVVHMYSLLLCSNTCLKATEVQASASVTPQMHSIESYDSDPATFPSPQYLYAHVEYKCSHLSALLFRTGP
jgi:hypothetical protein